MFTYSCLTKELFQSVWYRNLLKMLVSTNVFCILLLFPHQAVSQDCNRLAKPRALDSCNVKSQLKQLRKTADAIVASAPNPATGMQRAHLLLAAATLEDWTNKYLKPNLAKTENRTTHFKNLVRAGGYYEWSAQIPNAYEAYKQARLVIPESSPLCTQVSDYLSLLERRLKKLDEYENSQYNIIPANSSSSSSFSGGFAQSNNMNGVSKDYFKLVYKKLKKNQQLDAIDIKQANSLLCQVYTAQQLEKISAANATMLFDTLTKFHNPTWLSTSATKYSQLSNQDSLTVLLKNNGLLRFTAPPLPPPLPIISEDNE